MQWCFQTKAGNIRSNQLRVEVQPQIHLMRAGNVVHPSFDKDLPRRIVVVTIGRLVGSAGSELDQVEDYFKKLGEPTAEVWDIDRLVPNLVSTLVTRHDVRTQARLLEMVGRLQNMRGTRADIAGLAELWLAPGATEKEHWRDALTACLLASTAAKAGREDLAQQPPRAAGSGRRRRCSERSAHRRWSAWCRSARLRTRSCTARCSR